MFAAHYENPGLALHIRVGLYAEDHDGQRLERGQLRAAVDPLSRPAEIARAVRRAIRAGLLAPGSTARCLHSLLTDDVPPVRRSA
jgi:hypothetical protein